MMAQVHGQHQDVGDALVALSLEVVLGHPEGVVAGPVHQLGHGLRLVEDRRQVLVGQPPVVDRRALQPRVLKVHVPRKKAPKPGNHAQPPL